MNEEFETPNTDLYGSSYTCASLQTPSSDRQDEYGCPLDGSTRYLVLQPASESPVGELYGSLHEVILGIPDAHDPIWNEIEAVSYT